MKRSPPDLVLFRAFGRHMAVSTAEQSTLKTRSGSYDFNRDAHIAAGKLGSSNATTCPASSRASISIIASAEFGRKQKASFLLAAPSSAARSATKSRSDR